MCLLMSPTQASAQMRSMNYISASRLISSSTEDGTTSLKSFAQLRGPNSCAVNKDGMLVVCEWRGHSVALVNSEGEIAARFGNKDPTEDSPQFRGIFQPQKQSSSQLFGSKVGELHEPTGVAITDDNHIAVCDSKNNRIQLFNSLGLPVASAPISTSSGNATHPYDLAIDSKGLVYVSCPFNHTVSVLNTDMSFSHEIKRKGKAAKAFTPLGMAIDSSNVLYACDRDNSCVQKLSLFGDVITTYKVDHLINPVRVAVDSNDTLYVAYSYSAEIAMFTNEGQYIGRFGGDCESSKRLRRPRGITVDSEKIYICDTVNNEVVIF